MKYRTLLLLPILLFFNNLQAQNLSFSDQSQNSKTVSPEISVRSESHEKYSSLVAGPLGLTYSSTGTSCPGTNDASLMVYGFGGAPPYVSYSITGPLIRTNNTGVFINLPPGTYDVSLTDSAGTVFNYNNIALFDAPGLTVSPNVSICSGSTVLSVSGGAAPYTWTASPSDPTLVAPNSAMPTVSPTTTTTYTVTSNQTTTRNLVTNGDFSSLNTGFASDYQYASPANAGGLQGRYGVVTNPLTWLAGYSSCPDHTSGTGPMMVVEGSSANAGNDRVWSQTIRVTPGQTYTFRYWVQSLTASNPAFPLAATNPASLETVINGTSLAAAQLAPAVITCGNWVQRAYTWNSGANVTAKISIYDRNVNVAGNDFALDDIIFAANFDCNLTESTTVYVATAAITGTTNILAGGSATLYFQGTPGATVSFTTVPAPATASVVLNALGAGSYSIPYLSATTTFSLINITTNGTPACTKTLTGSVTITVNTNTCSVPLAEVTIDSPQPVCELGKCTDLVAHYSNIGSTSDYVVSPIPYCPSFSFTGGTIIDATGDDTWSPSVPLPFKFEFYGNCYNNILVGTNGVVTFDIGPQVPLGYCNYPYSGTIPNPSFPIKNAIFGVYQDTDISLGALADDTVADNVQNVNYYVLDTGPNVAPNRVFVANFNELPLYLDACRVTNGLQSSQIVIHETTNIIEVFVKRRTSCSAWNSGNGLVGVLNQPGTLATVPPGRNTGTWSATNEAWRFYPKNVSPTSTQIQWLENGTPIGAVNQNPITVCPTTATTYTAVVTYDNCVTPDPQISTDIVVDVAAPLPLLSPQDITLCTAAPPPYPVNIDENAHILAGVPDPFNFIITYYESPDDANNEINEITDLAGFVVNSVLPKTIYVRLQDLATSGCANIRAFVIDGGGPSGTISYPNSPFCNSITTPQLVTETALTGGGTYSAVPNTLIINSATGSVTPSGSPVGIYTVSYDIPASPTCPAYHTEAQVEIKDCSSSCTVVASSVSQTVCLGSAIASMTYTVSGGAGSGMISAGALPAGVSGNFAAGVYTLSGTPLAVGTSNFTVSLTSGVDTCVKSVSIVVKAPANAGADGSTSVCESSTAVVNLLGLVTGEQPGGAWTRTGGTGGVFDAAAGTFTPSAGAATSTFAYTVGGAAPCPDDVSIATVNISPAPLAGADGTVNICGSSAVAIDLSSVITGEQAGGAWTRTGGAGGVFNAAAGTFTPGAGATSSIFTYTLAGTSPCPGDTSLAMVNIIPQLNAGADGNTAICESNTSVINLFSLITGEQPGGVWTRGTGTGGVFNAAAGTFTPAAGATTSTFDYTLTGTAPCVTDSSTATVSISAQPDAGADGITTVCDSNNSPINLSGLITGGQPGGVWARNGGSGGVFNAASGTFTPAAGATTSTFIYTLTGSFPCTNDTSMATVNINPQPDAGADGGTTVCDGSTSVISLFSLVTGEQPGGVWTRTGGTGGAFNAVAGTFTPAPGATTSTFSYTLTGISPCINDASVATVNINPQPDAGADGSATVCDSSTASVNLFSLVTGEQPGGVWTRTGGTGGAFNAAAGTFTPAPGATTSTFSYTLTGISPCTNDTSMATVNINPQPDAGADGSATVCDSNNAPINLPGLITGEQPGGVWTRTGGTGGAFNAAAGTFTPAAGATTSTFSYTLTGISPCINDASVATVNINPQPDAGADGSATVCDSDNASINLFSLITGGQAGGAWIRIFGTGGVFNAAAGTFIPAVGATTSIFTYTIIAGTGCLDDSSTATVNITPRADAGSDGNATVCETSTNVISLSGLITGEQPGGVWTRTGGTGGAFNAAAGTFTPAAGATTSTFSYTLTGISPCPGDTSVATVNINPQPDAGADGSTTVCDSSTLAISLSGLITGEQTGGIWTRASGSGGVFNAVAGTFTPGAGALTSTFTYTIAGAAPCLSDSSLAAVNISPQPDAGADGSISVCQGSQAPIVLSSLITGEQSGGIWTRVSGSGGVFNGALGTFTPVPGAVTSTFAYTITAIAPCVDDSSLATVNINVQPDAGADGNVAVCESSTLAISLSGLITGEQPGGTWTRTSGSGGVFNAAAGTFTPAVGSSSSTFAYTIAGTAPCTNDTSLARVNVSPQPDAGSGSGVTVCEGSSQPVVLSGLITGEQPGGVWARTSGSGGVFNAGAGTFTPAIGATNSTFTYAIAGVAPCTGDSSQAVVNISRQPDAGINGGVAICETSSAVIVLAGLITGEQPGGVWTRTSGTGGVFNAGAGTFTPAIGATSSTFTYTISAAAPCTSDSSLATVTISAQPNAGSNGSVTVCGLSADAVDLFSLIGGEQPGGAWTRASGSGGVFNAAAGTFTPSANAVSSVFTYTISAAAPCLPDSSTASVTITGALQPLFAPVAAICAGDALGALPTVSANGVGGSWSPAPDNMATTTYTFTPSGGQCAKAVVMTITVNPLPVVSLPQDGYICLDANGNPSTTFELSTGLGAGYSFAWTGPSGTASGGSYLAGAPGDYSVTVTNTATGCSNTAQARVITSFPPQIVKAVPSGYFAQQQLVTVSVFPAGDYQYQLDDGAFQDSNQFISVGSGDHTVHVRDRVGCGQAQDDFRIIDYPKFFTPNGDGYNDTWNIPDLGDQLNSKIYIFDRYGQLMKEISPRGTGWDGTLNGKELPSTDYWFKVFFEEDGLSKVFRSHFSLKR